MEMANISFTVWKTNNYTDFFDHKPNANMTVNQGSREFQKTNFCSVFFPLNISVKLSEEPFFC